jgi:hypothetical protein
MSKLDRPMPSESPTCLRETLRERKYNKLSFEGGFMYPFTPIAESVSIAYYIPSCFIQLKYSLLNR